MGEKGNVADAANVVVGQGHNVVTETLSSGVDIATGIATSAVTGVATGLAKDKVDERRKKPDEHAD